MRSRKKQQPAWGTKGREFTTVNAMRRTKLKGVFFGKYKADFPADDVSIGLYKTLTYVPCQKPKPRKNNLQILFYIIISNVIKVNAVFGGFVFYWMV